MEVRTLIGREKINFSTSLEKTDPLENEVACLSLMSGDYSHFIMVASDDLIEDMLKEYQEKIGSMMFLTIQRLKEIQNAPDGSVRFTNEEMNKNLDETAVLLSVVLLERKECIRIRKLSITGGEENEIELLSAPGGEELPILREAYDALMKRSYREGKDE